MLQNVLDSLWVIHNFLKEGIFCWYQVTIEKQIYISNFSRKQGSQKYLGQTKTLSLENMCTYYWASLIHSFIHSFKQSINIEVLGA